MKGTGVKFLCRRIAAGAFLPAVLLTGCSGNPMAALYDNESAIVSDSNSYNLDGLTQQIEDDTLEITVEKMEGMDTIWSFEADYEAEISMTYRISLESGKLKLVLISPDGDLTTLAECSPDMGLNGESIIPIEPGVNRIKVVTDEDTKFTLDLSIPEGELRELGF